ncbi:MAG: hypothetical protein LUE88_04305 [Clostridiales bacterium]|nr:hypothetical protein [Clostridiales bacterium]
MDRRPSRNTYSRRYSSKNRKKQAGETIRFGNQLSVSIILCVFVLILAFTDSSATKSLKDKTSALIGRNVMDEFEAGESLKENVIEFVRCMFSSEEDDSDVINAEKIITDDIKSTSDEPPAAESIAEDAEPE